MKRSIHLIRGNMDSDKPTLGNLFVIDQNLQILFAGKSLELPWRNNQRRVSCIPPGSYEIKYEWSPAFVSNLWELKEVPDRSEIKIHAANFQHQLLGCIALGDRHIFIDDDQFKDVRNSRKTLNRFHNAMHGVKEAVIHIYF